MTPFDNAMRFVNNYSSCLSDPTRLRIMLCIAQNPSISVLGICSVLNETKGTLGYHLKQLRQNDVVYAERSGKKRLYSLNWENLRIFKEALGELFSK